MMERPCSAPPTPSLTEQSASDSGRNVANEETASIFREMEARSANNMENDNRGHKLSLDELPRRGPLWTKSSLESDEPQTIEQEFVNWQHFSRNSQTMGLSKTEVRLLYTYWTQYAEAKNETIRKALHGPTRLHDSINNMNVRASLSGITLIHLSDALMEIIEETHNQHKLTLRLIDALNSRLLRLESSIEGQEWLYRDPFEEITDKTQILSLLALATKHANLTDRYLAQLSLARSRIVKAIEYGRVLGRFLTKRFKKHLLLRKTKTIDSDSTALII